MSEDQEPLRRQAAIQYMMRRLDGFARGLGLDEAATREIVMRIAADMPERSDEDRLESTRRCLLAAASA
jgi:hypothetical protein